MLSNLNLDLNSTDTTAMLSLFPKLAAHSNFISAHAQDYQVLVTIQGKINNIQHYLARIGMIDKQNIFILDYPLMFVQGGKESDSYIWDNTENFSVTYINNYGGTVLDVLSTTYTDLAVQNENGHLLLRYNPSHNVTHTLYVNNYFKAPLYQHLMILDDKYQTFLPITLHKTVQLVRFYYQLEPNRMDMDSLTKDSNTKIAVLYGTQKYLKLFYIGFDLVITVCDDDDVTIMLTLRDFIAQPPQLQDFQLYLYNNNGIYDRPIDLHNVTPKDDRIYETINPKEILSIYDVDFKINVTIWHNQKLIKPNGSKHIPVNVNATTVGVLRFHQILPVMIELSRIELDLVISSIYNTPKVKIKNFYKNIMNINYQVSVFEFPDAVSAALPIEEIIIYHPMNHWYSILNQLEQARIQEQRQLDLHSLTINGNMKCYDVELLTCILTLDYMLVPDIDKMLGFDSPNKLIEFARSCIFNLQDISVLLECIDSNEQLVELYKDKLQARLYTRGYEQKKTEDIIKMMEYVITTELIKPMIERAFIYYSTHDES